MQVDPLAQLVHPLYPMPPHCPYLATVQPEGLVGWLPEEADEVLLLLVVATTVEVLRVVATTVEEVGRVEVVGWEDGGVEPVEPPLPLPEPLQVNTSGPGTV